MTPLEFLNLLWQYKPEDLYLLIWTLQDKRSHWYQEVAPAGKFVAQQNGHDVYVGVGLARRNYGPAHRCVSDDIAGITGFWADLDLRSDAHNKKELRATISDALSIIPPSMLPTIVVSTGNGAHAWWLFKEPYLFDDEEDRKGVARLVTRWQTMLRLNAASRGLGFRPAFRPCPRAPDTRHHQCQGPEQPEGSYSPFDHGWALQPVRLRGISGRSEHSRSRS
ncbi:MAG: hypothetical protein HY647_00390 [Acidobacteria bacterium]|nr:hypothetical protein [Acidobacteriota bacterium]